jgi:hypothetical protein
MSLSTNSLDIGSLADLAKSRAIDNVVHSGSGWLCNASDCPNGVLVGRCDPGSLTSRNERCACLNTKNRGCDYMKKGTGTVRGTIMSAKFNPVQIDGSKNCPGGSDPCPNWSCPQAFGNLMDKFPEITCSYPYDVIPFDYQAEKMAKNIGSGNNEQFLANYCFSDEEDKNKCFPFTSCPKAISRRDICDKLGQYNKDLYDQRAIAYCRDIYNKNKSNPNFNIDATGCRCLVDATINRDPGLDKIMTIPSLASPVHCIWGPCVPTSANLNSFKDLSKTCPTVSCLSLINVGGDAAIDKSQFIQNLTCSGETKCNCRPGETCDDKTGICSCSSDTACGPNNYCDSNKRCQPKIQPQPSSDWTWLIILIIIIVILLFASSLGVYLYNKE